jgi:hypothetical protein
MSEKMDGYMRDSQGRLVPVEMVSDLDRLRDEVVLEIVAKALAMRETLSEFKAGIREELTSYISLSAERYGKKYGGKKGNVTLTSYDGSLRLVLSINENIVFDERLRIAKDIIDECITRWSEGSRSEIRALVADAFYVDKTGRINTGRILGLRRLAIQDPQWQQAMEAISDSVQIVGGKEYLRIYTRDESGEYKQVPLDIATL